MTVEVAWFDELSLDPHAHPVAMGIRALGARPWLVTDEHRYEELAIKASLLDTHRDQVLYTTAHSVDAARELASLVKAKEDPSLHPIEAAARSVQEDLCLLQRLDDGWHLDASCLCAPTRWHLREKVGQHIAAVHGPVGDYDPRITEKVDQLFDRLTERAVWRRNWFLMTDPTLFQPDRPEHETIIDRRNVHEQLLVRSERQTLRRIDANWIVFTIRIQQEPLRALLTTPERIARFHNWCTNVSDDFGRRRHLTPPQRSELLASFQ